MRATRQTWMLLAPPPGRSVSEAADYQEEREARIAEMTVLAQKHAAKATLPHPEGERIACLSRMLENLRREHTASARQPERAGHLADAIRDLETLIARATLHPSATMRGNAAKGARARR